MPPSTEAVKVVVRARPMNSSETSRGNQRIVSVDRESNQVTIQNLKTNSPKTFAYDSVFDESCSQQLVYDETAFPLVESVLQGYNGTVFAYGQTGCGKTYTMVGVQSDPDLRGIIPNSFSHIFSYIGESQKDTCFLVRCSYSEIYNEEVRDLLNYDPKTKLELKESKDQGVYVKNLSMQVVKSIEDIEKAMDFGNSHRITKETNMNERSSRSHAIFTIHIETSESSGDKQMIKAGKLNLVDLAGSERQKKTGVSGDRLKEAIEINLSLSALGNVISALVDGNVKHVPYRDSKLTRLLQDSLGGNTKTLMIAVVSPADYNFDESLSTLRYASRAKFIQNKPKVNEDPKDAMLREYAEEIQRLKKMLEERGGEPQVVEKVVEKVVEYPQNAEPKKTPEVKVLESDSETEDDQRPNVHEELQLKEQHLQQERQQKEDLQKKLEEIQQKLIGGGEALDEAEQERLRVQREFQLRLKKQKKKQKKLLEETKKKEEEMLMKENNYQNLQEEVEDLRKVIKKLRSKYKGTVAEIRDLNYEHEAEKEALLDSIRSKERECDFLYKVLYNILSESEIRKIKKKSKFDEDNHVWHVPPFILQQNKTMFPKLPKAQVREMVSNDLRSRNIVYKSPEMQYSPLSEDTDYVNEDLRYARFESEYKEVPVTKCNDFGNLPNKGMTQEVEDRPITSGAGRMRVSKNVKPSLAPINHKVLSEDAQLAVSGQETLSNKPSQTSKKNPILQPLNHQPKGTNSWDLKRNSSNGSIPSYS